MKSILRKVSIELVAASLLLATPTVLAHSQNATREGVETEVKVQDNSTSNRWLAYTLVELTAILPSIPKWQFVVRVHHRSAAFGLFEDNLKGASNAVGVGTKYRW